MKNLNLQNLSGLVLCGGQSSRMGQDKGLLSCGDTVWAKSAARKLEAAGLKTFISLRQEQKKNYTKFFSERNFIFDDPALKIEGPLLGLFSAHREKRETDWLVLACDMINVTAQILEDLLSLYIKEKGCLYYLVRSQDRMEPLCAIYTSKGLMEMEEKMEKELTEGKPPDYSLYRNIKPAEARFLEISFQDAALLKSFNTKNEFKSIQQTVN